MSLILVTGAVGRHGGTGAHVARRLRQEGHQVRVLVRRRDERSAALEAEGFDVRAGDLRDRAGLLPAMVDVEQATFCFPVDAGIVEAAANFASALRKVSPDARLVVMSMLASQESGPSHLGRAAWLAEELLAGIVGRLCILRVAALFHENLSVLHGHSIRAEGVIRNCFGDARVPWMAAADAAELMVAALLEPDRFPGQTVCYPLGGEVLSHAQVAEIVSAELGRSIRYEFISERQWLEELSGPASHGHPALNPEMARHITALAAAIARAGDTPRAMPNERSLVSLIGRASMPLRDFVRQTRAEWLVPRPSRD